MALKGSLIAGYLTAENLHEVLQSERIQRPKDALDESVSPYGRIPRLPWKTRDKEKVTTSTNSHADFSFKKDLVVKRKRHRKLDPIQAVATHFCGQSNVAALQSGNQKNSEVLGLEAPDEQDVKQLRLRLQQTKLKLERNADRLKGEIQWIHGHFPVLKLANVKCSRTLRQQLFQKALARVSTNFMQRTALSLWYRKLLDAKCKERASHQLITMVEKRSHERVAAKFTIWQRWVLECQRHEYMAAAITLQRFAWFLRSRRQEREFTNQQMTLAQRLQDLSRNATTIQRAYRWYRRTIEKRRCEAVEKKIQHIEMRRRAYNTFIKQQQAVKRLQQVFRAHLLHKRAKAIAQLLIYRQEKDAQRIQNAWLGYKAWHDYEVLHVVQALVDHAEYLASILSIQRHVRGFQCRNHITKMNSSASCIQRRWRAGRCRMVSRVERQMMHGRRDLAVSRIQRAFRRKRQERSIDEQSYLPIATNAITVIQTTWRRHVAYKREDQRKRSAAMRIRQIILQKVIWSKWQTSVFGMSRHRHDAAARALKQWLRRFHKRQKMKKMCQLYMMEHIAAATSIQRWYRHYRRDQWRLLLTCLLYTILPRHVEAVSQISRCWKAHSKRKQDQIREMSNMIDLMERKRCAEAENRAAFLIQRKHKQKIARRDGKLLLHKYRILLREEKKRQHQRAIVHEYLEEKSKQRMKRQEIKGTTSNTRRTLEEKSSQVLTLSSTAMEKASAFVLGQSLVSTGGQVEYWSDEYQRAYLYDPVTGVSTWR